MKTAVRSRKQRNTIVLCILFLPLAIGDVALLTNGKSSLLDLGMPLGVTIIAAVLLSARSRGQEGRLIEGDERNMRIEGRAFSYSWALTLYAVCALVLNDALGLLALTVRQNMFILLAVLLGSFWIALSLLSRKGDVEA